MAITAVPEQTAFAVIRGDPGLVERCELGSKVAGRLPVSRPPASRRSQRGEARAARRERA
jgi:hypothetical protein